jgi:hypothetical protein
MVKSLLRSIAAALLGLTFSPAGTERVHVSQTKKNMERTIGAKKLQARKKRNKTAKFSRKVNRR